MMVVWFLRDFCLVSGGEPLAAKYVPAGKITCNVRVTRLCKVQLFRIHLVGDIVWLIRCMGANTAATGVGVMRIMNNRHWTSDVLVGAGIGIL